MFEYENKYKIQFNNSQLLIAGVDEAGRGPLAGPVVCAACIMPLDDASIITGINDSKKLSEKKRTELFEKIIEVAVSYNVAIICEKDIEDLNILGATKKGMLQAINGLHIKPDFVLLDAVNLLDLQFQSESIIKGDAKSYTIACASILAKVTRDKLMIELHEKYPAYNLKKHKGYGTKEHINNIQQFGPCEIHRNSFIQNILKGSSYE